MEYEIEFEDPGGDPGGQHGVDQLAHRANLARVHVGLDKRVCLLRLVLDAPELSGSGFWQCETGPDGGIIASLYGAVTDLLYEVSKWSPPGFGKPKPPPEGFDLLRVDRWLHRHLLQLDDLLRGRVDPRRVPPGTGAGLQACWDVWTDGRLRAWQHPGLSIAERRAAFLRTFSKGTPLLPRHWAVFHALWEGSLEGHDGLLEAVSKLPPVPG